MNSFTSDPARTRDRIAQLESYFAANVLRGEDFVCGKQKNCRQSHPHTFDPAVLPHVGKHYDLELNRRPFRVVVVGQEPGDGSSLVSLTARHSKIAGDCGLRRRFFKEGSISGRNPHMRGTTSLLRLIFGCDVGADYRQEFVPLQQESAHLFECFALANFLLCSATASPQSTRGCSTSTMRENCSHHFEAAIKILEPTLLVFQGKGVRDWARDLLPDIWRTSGTTCAIKEMGNINGQPVTLIGLSHPSAPQPDLNWGRSVSTPYLEGTVKPTIEEAIFLHITETQRSRIRQSRDFHQMSLRTSQPVQARCLTRCPANAKSPAHANHH